MKDKHAVLSTVEFEDVAQNLPEVQPFSCPEGQIDIFICALGFEDRVLAIPTRLSSSSWYRENRIPKAIVCTYTTNFQENEAKRENLENVVLQFCQMRVELRGDFPGELARELRKELFKAEATNAPLRVMFDISAASGNLIMSVMHVLVEYSSTHHLALTIAYSEPEEYCPSEENFQEEGEDLVLSACRSGDSNSLHEHGVSEVEINELYPGDSQENRPEYIIAIPSYRTERLSRCLQRLTDEPLADPDQFIHWILGAPPSDELHWRLELQSRVIRRLLSELAGGDEESANKVLTPENHSVASTLDYRQIMRLIFHLVDRNLGKNLSVVHMGSKLQAIGVSLTLAARPEVTVCYAKPTRYNTAQYSQGIGPAWQIRFPDLAPTVAAMHKVGTLRFIPRTEPERLDLRDEWDPQPSQGV